MKIIWKSWNWWVWLATRELWKQRGHGDTFLRRPCVGSDFRIDLAEMRKKLWLPKRSARMCFEAAVRKSWPQEHFSGFKLRLLVLIEYGGFKQETSRKRLWKLWPQKLQAQKDVCICIYKCVCVCLSRNRYALLRGKVDNIFLYNYIYIYTYFFYICNLCICTDKWVSTCSAHVEPAPGAEILKSLGVVFSEWTFLCKCVWDAVLAPSFLPPLPPATHVIHLCNLSSAMLSRGIGINSWSLRHAVVQDLQGATKKAC